MAPFMWRPSSGQLVETEIKTMGAKGGEQYVFSGVEFQFCKMKAFQRFIAQYCEYKYY